MRPCVAALAAWAIHRSHSKGRLLRFARNNVNSDFTQFAKLGNATREFIILRADFSSHLVRKLLNTLHDGVSLHNLPLMERGDGVTKSGETA